MINFIALLAVLLLPLPAHAAINEIIEWNAVTVTATVDKEAITLSAGMQDHRFTRLMATIRGKRVPVPIAELEGLPPHIAIRTIRIVSPDSKRAPGPTFHVEMQALPKGDGNAPSATVRFFFNSLSYVGRTIDFEDSGVVTSRVTKLVGQPSEQERR